MDPIISKVASQIGLSQPQLHRLLPSELTLWVDPYEVSYRIGEDGSICVLYQEAPAATSYGLLTCMPKSLNKSLPVIKVKIFCILKLKPQFAYLELKSKLGYFQ